MKAFLLLLVSIIAIQEESLVHSLNLGEGLRSILEDIGLLKGYNEGEKLAIAGGIQQISRATKAALKKINQIFKKNKTCKSTANDHIETLGKNIGDLKMALRDKATSSTWSSLAGTLKAQLGKVEAAIGGLDGDCKTKLRKVYTVASKLVSKIVAIVNNLLTVVKADRKHPLL